MTVKIRMEGAFADDELRSLYEWLLNEPEIRQGAQVQVAAKTPQPGEMGTALDAITLVTTSVIGLPSMIEVIKNWRHTRRRKPQIIIERDGYKATFIDVDPEAVIDILDKVGRD